MTSMYLKSVYQKRINCFLNGASIFDEYVLSKLIEGFNGYVATFLYECFLILRNNVIQIHKNQIVDMSMLNGHFNRECLPDASSRTRSNYPSQALIWQPRHCWKAPISGSTSIISPRRL
jgi:hypothetical protein